MQSSLEAAIESYAQDIPAQKLWEESNQLFVGKDKAAKRLNFVQLLIESQE